tara:strand:- start:49 stop:1185 length:1137 start_codon:yes stop_codon:yes gene_type:complete
MIPSGYKAGKLYSVLPMGKDGDFTFTRNTVGTRINKSGLIEEVAVNVPRLDYSDGGCPSLLLEPTATNLVTYSEDFTQWQQNGVSIISNSAISPDGTLNADKITATTVDPAPYILANVTATEHTFSFYYKGEANSIGKEARVLFWFTGTATGTNLSVPFTVTGDWQRFESQITPTGAGTLALRIDFPADDAVVGDYGYLWGAQMEENSYATSYIKTVGSPQTRVADTASGSGNSTVINSTEGVLYAEISALAETNLFESISLNNNSTSDRVFMGYYSDDLYITVYVGGQVKYDVSTPISVKQNNKIAIKYKAQDFSLYLNGSQINASVGINGGTTPIGLSQLSFNRGDGVEPFYGKVKSLQVYTTALSDAELTSLTTI